MRQRIDSTVLRTERFLKRVLPVIEVLGCVLVGTGLVVEYMTGADIGYQLITGGGFVVGVGSFLWAKVYKK